MIHSLTLYTFIIYVSIQRLYYFIEDIIVVNQKVTKEKTVSKDVFIIYNTEWCPLLRINSERACPKKLSYCCFINIQ